MGIEKIPEGPLPDQQEIRRRTHEGTGQAKLLSIRNNFKYEVFGHALHSVEPFPEELARIERIEQAVSVPAIPAGWVPAETAETAETLPG